MMTARYRAMVMLKAKPGKEDALLGFALDVAPRIRAVDGLEKLEVNRAVDDPGRLVLYYWWASPGHSDRYVDGPLYAEIMPVLKELIAEHLLVMSENLDG
jgi:quinol monooxygenase YgiN